MDNETIRTLITAISAVVTTGTVAGFGYLSLSRKDKLEKLKNEAMDVLQQFDWLYKVEEELLARLEDAGKGNKVTIKIEVRKKITGESDGKITLTSERIKEKISEIKKM